MQGVHLETMNIVCITSLVEDYQKRVSLHYM